MSKETKKELRKLKFEPRKWEEYIDAGCYPYALDLFCNQFILVGDFIGKRCNEKVSDKFLVDTLKEELSFLGYQIKEIDTEYCIKKEYEFKIYLQRDEHTGYYHFLRQDISDIWSHKFPKEVPTNIDSYGQLIENPETMIESPFYGWCFLLRKTS